MSRPITAVIGLGLESLPWGDTETMGQYSNQKWSVCIPKEKSDLDAQGRLRLNCIGTLEDLARQQISLRDGRPFVLYSEDLEIDGVVRYSAEENLWVAVIDWDAIREQPSIVFQTEHQLQLNLGR